MPHHSHWLTRLLLIWSISAGCISVVMLTHDSDSPVIVHRYSLLVIVTVLSLILAGMGALIIRQILLTRPVLLGLVDTQLAQWRSKPWFLPCIVLFCMGLPGLIWVFFASDRIVAHHVLICFSTLSGIIFGLALLFSGREQADAARWRIVFVACLIGLIVIALVTIDQRPALLKADEGFFASEIQSVLNTDGAVTRPLMYRFVFQTSQGGLWTRLALPYFRAVGLSLSTGRLFFFLLTLASLPFMFVALKRQYDSITGWVGTILALYAFSSFNFIRPEAESALLLAAALCCYSLGNRWSGWHLLAGLTAALCIDGSLITYCFGLGFGLVYLGRYVNEVRTSHNWRWSPFWLALAGEAIAISYFLLTHQGNWATAAIIQSQAVFSSQESTAQMASQYIASIGQHITSGSVIALTRDWLYTFIEGQPLLSSLAAIGLVVAFWQRKPMDVVLLTLVGTWLLVIVSTYIYFPGYDFIPGIPLIAALAARGVVFGVSALINVETSDNLRYIRTLGIMLSILLLITSIGDLKAAKAPGISLNDVVKTGTQIAQIVPKNAVIMADEPFYFGMIDHPNFVEALENTLMVQNLHYSGVQAWDTIAPQAIVFPALRPPGHTPELDTYMQQHHFGLAGCWQTASYGRIELWMVNPPSAVSGANCPLVTN